jgi:hypothetical protein
MAQDIHNPSQIQIQLQKLSPQDISKAKEQLKLIKGGDNPSFSSLSSSNKREIVKPKRYREEGGDSLFEESEEEFILPRRNRKGALQCEICEKILATKKQLGNHRYKNHLETRNKPRVKKVCFL